MRQPAVYIVTNRPNGTLYTGVTSNLRQRAWQHRAGAVPGFTARYGVNRLVWAETHDSADIAIRREKQIKEWRRDWKVNLIQDMNPDWRDLYEDLTA